MNAIIQQRGLGFTWDTVDPFLLCVHHDDAYPRGNGQLGPDASLAGRDIGQDFAGKDGWRMYHGRTVPGFPSHPHRGFETVTIVRKGFIDHADSLGAAARFGNGDVQWLTAGRGVVHSEMFPLLRTDQANPLELFQIWLNLPAAEKMAAPHFTMFWSEDIPHHVSADTQGRTTEITSIAGQMAEAQGVRPLAPPPHSWAAAPASDVAIWTIKMAPNAHWTLPAAANAAIAQKSLLLQGSTRHDRGNGHQRACRFGTSSDQAVELINGDETSEFLLLQGRPINETVVQSGPFVMNSPQEITQAFADYSRTRFGGWPWPDAAPVHGGDYRRFATYADGQTQTKPIARAA